MEFTCWYGNICWDPWLPKTTFAVRVVVNLVGSGLGLGFPEVDIISLTPDTVARLVCVILGKNDYESSQHIQP
jgi:hypothetical protein